MAERYYSSVAVETALSGSIDGSATSIGVDATTGFPAQTPFTIAVDIDTASEELMEVTATVGSTWTVTRGVDGTTGLSHEAGASVVHVISARDLQNARDHEEASTGVHGVDPGDVVVGATTTATLEGKTIDGGDNTLQNVPQSAITNLTSDQATQDNRLTTNESNISTLTTDFTNHKDDNSNVHGVSFLVGTADVQTLTNKTIDGDQNTLRDIELGALKRAVLNLEGDGTDRNLGGGNERLRTTFNTLDNVGGFQQGSVTAERIVPFTGLYLIQQHARVIINSGEPHEEVELRIRRNGTPGETDGSIISRTAGNFHSAGSPEAFISLVEVVSLNAGDRVKFTMDSQSGNPTVEDDGHPDWKYAAIIYLGPA